MALQLHLHLHMHCTVMLCAGCCIVHYQKLMPGHHTDLLASLALAWQVHVAKLKCCVQKAILVVVWGYVGRLLHSRICWHIKGPEHCKSICLLVLPCHECTAPGPCWSHGWEARALEGIERRAIVGSFVVASGRLSVSM